MKVNLPSDFAKEIGKVLVMTAAGVEAFFDIDEDKMGFFVAKLKPKMFLDKAQFRAMCALVRDLGGESYLAGMKAWMVPGPYAKKPQAPESSKTVATGSTESPKPVTTSIPGPQDARGISDQLKYDKSKPPVLAQERVLGITSDEIMVSNIPTDKLELGSFSPRMQFDPKYVAKLAEDIEAEGQLKPIMVRPHPTEPEKYQVIDGEHRVRALQKLGKTLVRAEVHALSDEEAYYRAMRINQLHGKALEELEEACHINKMMALFGLTQEQIGKQFVRSRQWVSQRLDLALRIAPKVEEYVGTRVASTRHAVEIAQLPKEDQERVVEKVAETKLSTRATRAVVQAIKKAPERRQEILEHPLEVYAAEFKDPKQLEKALLTIGPEDDFLAKAKEIKTKEQVDELFDEALVKGREPVTVEKCPGCGKQLRVDWVKGEVSWS
jgi:ParB family chromosome partitioning protein